MWAILYSVASHHADSADPTLLAWIKEVLDHWFGVGPWAFVAVLAVIILAMPLGLIAFYLSQRRRETHTPQPPVSTDR